MQSSIANGEQRNFAGNSSSFDHVVKFMPDVEVISVDPNAFYTSSDEDDDDYVIIDDDPAVMIAVDPARGIPSNMMLANESGLTHDSHPLLPDSNLFDVIALNINDDIQLPDLQYDDIFLTNNRVDEAHHFDLASYINGDCTSLLLSPVEVSSMSSRRSFENRTSLARKRISFSMDLDDDHTKSHLVNTSSQTTVNTSLHNNRFRAKPAPCDIDSKMYLNDSDEGENDIVSIVSSATIPTTSNVPTTTVEPCNEQTNVALEVSQPMDNVNNSQIVEEITIDEVKIEEFVEEPLPISLPKPPTPPSPSPPSVSIDVISEDSMSSNPSIGSNYEASAEVTEASNENTPERQELKCEHSSVSETSVQQQSIDNNETNTELPVAEQKPKTKRKLNIQEYLRRKMLKTVSEEVTNTKDCATATTETKSNNSLNDTVNKTDQNTAVVNNKSLYEEIIVVSMGCNTDISIPATPFIQAENSKLAKSTALLCNIQSAVEKLNSTTDTSKLSSSSLISSIQDVILKKSTDSAVGGSSNTKAHKPIKTENHDTNNENNDDELEHGENKVIMHLPRDRIRPITWSVSIQTDPYFQFPPLETLPPITTKKAHVKEFGEHSRDSQYHSRSDRSDHESSSSSSSSDDEYSASESTISSGGSMNGYNSSRTYYNDEHGRRTHRTRRSSNSSGYGTYGSSKRAASPGKFNINHFHFYIRVVIYVFGILFTEERRIVYVGHIEEHASKSDLYRKFSKYGAVKQISIHRKE